MLCVVKRATVLARPLGQSNAVRERRKGAEKHLQNPRGSMADVGAASEWPETWEQYFAEGGEEGCGAQEGGGVQEGGAAEALARSSAKNSRSLSMFSALRRLGRGGVVDTADTRQARRSEAVQSTHQAGPIHNCLLNIVVTNIKVY